MAKVFISFLGTGNPNAKADQPGYDVLTYRFEHDERIYTSMFAQRAIIEKHDPASFERICLMMTPESQAKHRDLLVEELLGIGCTETQLIEDASITTNQNTEQQWEWFDSLQKLINDGDEVIFDFTHGFRSVPIIFSTAISFLQKVKRFTLLHAHYGYMTERGDSKQGIVGKGEIIDMAKFYRINEWADGVARLVDMADASKLAELADEGVDDGFAALNDQKLTQALRDLTDLIKNIDVNNVGKKADEALKLIATKQQQCSGADAQLLEMVREKFTRLAIQGSGRYDHDYFQLQLVLTKVLLEHGLNMQAFTVMRECIASIGMLSLYLSETYRNKNLFNSDGRSKLRPRFGDVFVNLCQFDKQQWHYETEAGRTKLSNEPPKLDDYDTVLKPFYDQLETLGIAQHLQSFVVDMIKYRNGFDHAWTSKAEALPKISEKGQVFLRQLTEIIEMLREQKLLTNT
jgi:CRISPR-associated protein, TM1812 family